MWNVKSKGVKKLQVWSGGIFKSHILIWFFSFFLLGNYKEKKKFTIFLCSPTSIPFPVLFFTLYFMQIKPSTYYNCPFTGTMSFRISCSADLMTMNYFSWHLCKNTILNFILRISMLDIEFWADSFVFSFFPHLNNGIQASWLPLFLTRSKQSLLLTFKIYF